MNLRYVKTASTSYLVMMHNVNVIEAVVNR
jgi:hypothetical protein